MRGISLDSLKKMNKCAKKYMDANPKLDAKQKALDYFLNLL